MAKITNILGREVIDSRGNPTVEAELTLDSGETLRAISPSGASTGSREALELRDGDSKRYLGKGVLKAVANVNGPIAKALVGQELDSQGFIDKTLLELDGTENKANLGANAILSVSLAAAKALAAQSGQPLFRAISNDQSCVLPVPMMNIINGGAHADNTIDIQEFMIIPAGLPSFQEALRAGVETFHALKSILKKQGLNTAVGDEGGFAPDLNSNEQALMVVMQAIESVGLKPGKEVYLGLDIAASEIYKDGKYVLSADNRSLTAEQFADYQEDLVKKFPILSIEDGMAEDDWAGFKMCTERLGKRVQLVGDDLFVTHAKTLERGINEKICNAILIKFNQIGTVSETLDAITLAKTSNYGVVISHRSGETEDVTIADLAVGTEAGQIKTGSLCRTDRVAKYNQLLRIESLLGNDAVYAGMKAFSHLLLD